MSHEHHHHSEAEHNSPHAGHVNHFEAKKHISTIAEGVIYTCPMHPQIRQVGPGACPICGMTLEPLVSTAESEPSAELADMTRRFWIGLALTIPVFVLEMGGHFLDLHRFIPPQTSNWLQFALASPSCSGPAGRFSRAPGRSLVTRNLNMFTLIAMGTGVAWAVQRRGDIGSFCFPARVPRQRRLGPDLFRGGRGHHRAGSSRTSPRIARPRKDGRRHSRAARSRAQDGAADRGRRIGRRRSARKRRRRGSSARPARRKSAGGRGSPRRTRFGRRIDGHRRIHARDEERRRQAHRRRDQPDRRLRHAGRQGWPRHRAVAHRRHGRRGAKVPRADPASRRPGLRMVRAGSSSASRFWPSPRGRSGDRNRA